MGAYGAPMAIHMIEMKQTARLVNKVDVVFVVSSDEEGKLGELHLSKGGVDWWPKNSKKYFHRLNWEQFRNVIEESAPRRRRPDEE